MLPDGVGIRNFLVGPFRAEARDQIDFTAFSQLPESLRHHYETDATLPPIDWQPFRVYRDTRRIFMLRNVLNYAHIYSINTFGMKCMRDRSIKGRGLTRLAAATSRALGRAAAAVGGLETLQSQLYRAVERLPETAHYRAQFESTRPDLVLSSNQRPTSVLPVVLAARALGIPTATCIFSWDNLTSKARIAAPFDHYLVWSDRMKAELQQFYPHIADDRIHIVGAMQFDPHADPNILMSRADFCRQIGADPSRPLLCYSSGDDENSPEDQDHTELMLKLIREGRIHRHPQVVLRPSPASTGKRFESVCARYPELIYSRPQWIAGSGSWAQMFPLPGDTVLLANLVHHADMNVSVASTMTIDSAIHDRPIVNVAFDIATPGPFKYPLWDFYYKFEHYLPIVHAGAAHFSKSADEFVAHINEYLANPKLHEENRRHILADQLGVPLGQSSRRTVEVLRCIARRERVPATTATTRTWSPAAGGERQMVSAQA